MEFIRFFLILLVPGLVGSYAFSIASSLKTRCCICIALILDLFTFTTMITGLYYLKGVRTIEALLFEFNCLSFCRKYILLSLAIVIFFGVLFGLIRRIFFWIRHCGPLC